MNDYAILKLTEEVKTATNFLPLCADTSSLTTATIKIFGYPEQPTNYLPVDEKGSNWKAYQFGLAKTGQVLEVNSRKAELIHMISTKGGQSGAPIIMEDSQGKLLIVGIHKGGVKKSSLPVPAANSGRIITPDLIATLKEETEKLGAIPFKQWP